MDYRAAFRHSRASGLLGLLAAVAIMAALAVLLLRAMGSGHREAILLDDPAAASDPLPAHDGSLQSQLPNGIERRTRALETRNAERTAALEKLLVE